MLFNEIPRGFVNGRGTPVGPDVSRPPPIYRPVRNPPYTPIIVLKLITGKRRFTRGQRAYRPYQEPLLSQQVVYAEMRSRNVLDHRQKAIDSLKKFVPGRCHRKTATGRGAGSAQQQRRAERYSRAGPR